MPEKLRRHVSSGLAQHAGDGSPWCRIAHAAVCPASVDGYTVAGARTAATCSTGIAGTRSILTSGIMKDGP
ncbi:DUF6083 domain-containing protein [Streptomyces capoamus]|uniref:DUF6083 domain-containing protein n=1 Tax=Streptomyces capoamus TaxID=68183 RepID=UPI003C2AFE59